MMKLSRRQFFLVWMLPRWRQEKTAGLEVLEVFKTGSGPSALLVHHASPEGRESVAGWLRNFDGGRARLKTSNGVAFTGRVFRMKMCFGRGLILTDSNPIVRAKDTLQLD